MKAVAVTPGTPNSVHLEEINKPSVEEIADGKGVLVRVLKVGVDATDREINEALYGNAPEGDQHLVIGHECFGVIEEVDRMFDESNQATTSRPPFAGRVGRSMT